MRHYLIAGALVQKDDGDTIRRFSKLSKTSGCNIVSSYFTPFGQEIAVMLFLSGPWDAIAKIEDMLGKLSGEYGMTILTKRTEVANPSSSMMPYIIDIVGVDQVGVIFDIVDFVVCHNLVLREMSTNTYQASQTGTQMFSLHMVVNIPVASSIATVRGNFIDFCDNLNLDAVMEPLK